MRAQANGGGLIAATPAGLPPFRLYRPTSLDEAGQVLQSDADALVAAGTTDLFAQIREGLVPGALVSVRRLDELSRVTADETAVVIGAAVTHAQGQSDPTLRRVLPSFADAWGSIATVRIRESGTIGGNLMARRYRYEMPLLAGALDARLVFVDGHRQPVEWLWRSETGRSERLLTGVRVDIASLDYFGYERSMRPVTTLALAVRRSSDGLHVRALSGSEYRPGHVLETSARADDLRDLDVAQVSHDLAGQLPASAADYSGSHDYRSHLVSVLSARLLRAEQDRRTDPRESTHVS